MKKAKQVEGKTGIYRHRRQRQEINGGCVVQSQEHETDDPRRLWESITLLLESGWRI